MRTCLAVLHDGVTSSFEVTRIDRSKLYGSRRRIPVDAAGRKCRAAALTRDGMHVLPRGGIARLCLDESGNAVDRSDLSDVSTAGREAGTPWPSALAAFAPAPPRVADVAEVGEGASPEDLLDCDFSRAWALDPISLSPQLDAILSAGAARRMRLPLRLAKDSADAFILKGPVCFLLLVGEPAGFEPVGRDGADLTPENEDDDSLTDLDDDIEFGTL